MKYLILAICFLPKLFYTHVSAQNPAVVVPDCRVNFIHISGSTNVNSFQFKYNFQENDPFTIPANQTTTPDSSVYNIFVPVKEFKTTNTMMYHDFMHLLKEPQYPEIKIGIPVNTIYTISSKDSVKPEISITLAGVTRHYKILCHEVPCGKNTVTLNGSQVIDLTRFNLTPPEKFYGLVKVKKDVEIFFRLSFITETNRLKH